MDKTLELLKYTPSFFRDLLIAVYGAFAIVVLNYFVQPIVPNQYLQLFQASDRIERDAMFIVFAYVFGRLLHALNSGIAIAIRICFELFIFSVLNPKPLRIKLIELKTMIVNWRVTGWLAVSQKKPWESRTLEEVKYEVTEIQHAEAVSSNRFLSTVHDRHVYTAQFFSIMSSLALLLFLLVDSVSIFWFVGLFSAGILESIEFDYHDQRISRAIWNDNLVKHAGSD